MSLPVPSVVDRTKNWVLRRLTHSHTVHEKKKGLFYKAHGFHIKNANFIEADTYVTQLISYRSAVFEILEPYTCLDAAQDSSARYPPPRCHPGTRLKVQDRLMDWLRGDGLGWNMLWVRGFAGTGKSAVAQSFAESCDEEERLGGSYFFSRTTGRNRMETVVPTLVSQLAVSVPEYCSLIERQLAKNPFLLRKSPPIQFRKLIVEPFAILQCQRPLKPIAIILDGLDECEGVDAQLDLLEMITNAIRTNPDLPLRWLICSRPEAHLKDAFLKLAMCGREELVIDAECREDVAKYVREQMTKIGNRYKKFTPPNWPPEAQLEELLDTVSGLFVFASSCLNYIGDPKEADPKSQFDSLLTFMRRSKKVVPGNPLAALDLLYSQILENIPLTARKAASQILAYMAHKSTIDDLDRLSSAQLLCNFLQLDQHTFYKAMHGLYSVMSIPDSEDAPRLQLRFHHTSFQDFLLDPIRSGKFFISKQQARVTMTQSYIHWYEIDVKHFHTQDGWNLHFHDKHDSLPGLPWVSEDNRRLLSDSITTFLDCGLSFSSIDMQNGVDEGLLSQLLNTDFRYWDADIVVRLVKLCQLDPSTSIVRDEPSDALDHQLLAYFNIVIKNGVAKPTAFPLRRGFCGGKWIREYFFAGYGLKSVIVWRTQAPTSRWFFHSLRCDQVPGEEQVSEHEGFLEGIEWDEKQAALEIE